MKGGRFGNLRFRVLGGLVLLGCCLGLLSGGAGAAQAAGSAARHARLFSLERVGAVQVLRNAMPWGGATEERAWVLVPSGASVPSSLAKLPRISVPAKRVVALTIPAVSALSLLGCPDRIGVGGKRFLYDPAGVRGAAEVGRRQRQAWGAGRHSTRVVSPGTEASRQRSPAMVLAISLAE